MHPLPPLQVVRWEGDADWLDGDMPAGGSMFNSMQAPAAALTRL